MSFPPRQGGGGGGSDPTATKAIGLYLFADAPVGVGEIAKVPFDGILFNDGMSYSSTTREVTITEPGKILITASVGCLSPVEAFSISALLFKNDLPFRQHGNSIDGESAGTGVPYASAGLSVIDKAIVGDKYVLYVTSTGSLQFSLTATGGLTGMEVSYL